MTTRTSLLNCALLLCALSLLSACGNAQTRKANYLHKAQKYEAAGNLDKARLDYRNALQIDPKDPEIRFHLGQIAEKTGDVRTAVGLYQAVVSDRADYVPARAALGRILLYGGLADRALEIAEAGLVAAPDSALLLTVRGGARAQLGSLDAAMEDAHAAVKLDASDTYAIALLASLLRRQSKLDDAAAVVQSGLERMPNNIDLRQIMADLDLQRNLPEQAEAQLRAVVALEPGVLAHRGRLARAYLQVGDKDGAEKVLRAAVDELPGNAGAKIALLNFQETQRGAEVAQEQAQKFLSQAGSDDSLRLALADYLAQQGHGDRAEPVYRSIIDHAGAGPTGLTARDRLAALLFARKDAAGATALVNEVLKKNPHDNDALVLRAQMSIARGDARVAIDDLRSVLRDQPDSVPLMRMLARAYQENGENDQAEEMLRSAVQVAPADFDTKLALAQALSTAGKHDQAVALLEQLVKDKPENLQAESSLFQAHSAQKQYPEALAVAQNIQKLFPRQGLGFYLAGLVHQAMEKQDEAAQDYAHALKVQPGAGEPLTALVRLELLRKRIPAATAVVDAEIAREAANPVAHFLKGAILGGQGNADAAAKSFHEAMRLAPTWAQPYQDLAAVQEQAKRIDDAIATLRAGIQQTKGGLALVTQLSAVYERQGRIDEAIAVYDDVLKDNPKSLSAMNNLAMLLVTYKTDPQSLQRAQKLSEQLAAASDAQIMDTRGWVRFKSGDYHGAEALLQQAVDKAPSSPELRYHLGMAQARSGEQQAAEQNLQMAVTSRSFPGIDEARATLASLRKAPVG